MQPTHPTLNFCYGETLDTVPEVRLHKDACEQANER